ncbi:MAG: hypothetical protein AVDCRST_MAG85-853, partial [uncultured Solirubrobacteraceae bacterium]
VRLDVPPPGARRARRRARHGVPRPCSPRRRVRGVRRPPGLAVRPRRGRARDGLALARPRLLQDLHEVERARPLPRPDRPVARRRDQARATGAHACRRRL